MMNKCWICETTKGIHEHHIVPRAYGGINGPTVNLCGAHHTLVHNTALKKSPNERRKELEGHTEAQTKKLEELVYVIRRSRLLSRYMRRPMTLQVTLSPENAQKFRQLKKMLGASSYEQTVYRCINLVYTQNVR